MTGIGLAIVATMVGHSGGRLVYEHGAASAYVQPDGVARSQAVDGDEGRDPDERTEHDRR